VSTTAIILCHIGAAIILFLGFVITFARKGGPVPKPSGSPTAGPTGLEGVVTGAEPELVAPLTRGTCVAWRIMTEGDEGAWWAGPTDWADAILLRLDSGAQVRLILPDVTLTTGPQSVGAVDGLDFGGRPPRLGRNDNIRGVVREESIGIGDRVYVKGDFSPDASGTDDPMRREGAPGAPPTWSVRIPKGEKQVLLHGGGFADFAMFGSRSLRRYRLALSVTIPAFALYLLIALMVFGRLW